MYICISKSLRKRFKNITLNGFCPQIKVDKTWHIVIEHFSQTIFLNRGFVYYTYNLRAGVNRNMLRSKSQQKRKMCHFRVNSHTSIAQYVSSRLYRLDFPSVDYTITNRKDFYGYKGMT